mmetsp:Transcript_10511/g.37025  ORF Transcript_10511/g.37025 Transcript_10511/m.37025 type:complete len:932 (+) Transcript_10511:53-2848(+)
MIGLISAAPRPLAVVLRRRIRAPQQGDCDAAGADFADGADFAAEAGFGRSADVARAGLREDSKVGLREDSKVGDSKVGDFAVDGAHFAMDEATDADSAPRKSTWLCSSFEVDTCELVLTLCAAVRLTLSSVAVGNSRIGHLRGLCLDALGHRVWEPLLEPCTFKVGWEDVWGFELPDECTGVNISPPLAKSLRRLFDAVRAGMKPQAPAGDASDDDSDFDDASEDGLETAGSDLAGKRPAKFRLRIRGLALTVMDPGRAAPRLQSEALLISLDDFQACFSSGLSSDLRISVGEAQVDARKGRFPVVLRCTPRRRKLVDVLELTAERSGERMFRFRALWGASRAVADARSGEGDAPFSPRLRRATRRRSIVVLDALALRFDRSLDVYVDEDFIEEASSLAHRFLDQVAPDHRAPDGRARRPSEPAEPPKCGADTLVRISNLDISRIRARLSLRWKPAEQRERTLYAEAAKHSQHHLPAAVVRQGPQRFRALLDVFAAVERSRVTLPALRLGDGVHFGAFDDVVAIAKQYYARSAARNALEIAGSLRAIGNPLGLARGVLRGLEDAVREPVQGLIDGVDEARPEAFALGVARGASSLVRHTVGGTADSLASITGNFSRAASHLALDAEYRARQRAKDEARASRDVASARRTRLIEGLADGFDSAVGGVVDGVTGLVQEPMRGAERAGAAGVFLGLGRGVLGLAVKPVCGLADAATDVLRGIRNETAHLRNGAVVNFRREHGSNERPPELIAPPVRHGAPEPRGDGESDHRDAHHADPHAAARDDDSYDEHATARRPRRALYGLDRAIRPFSWEDARASHALTAACEKRHHFDRNIDAFVERVALDQRGSCLVVSHGALAVFRGNEAQLVSPVHLLLGCSLDARKQRALVLIAEPPPSPATQHVILYEGNAGAKLHAALAGAVERVHNQQRRPS